jgi:ribosomal protein L30E
MGKKKKIESEEITQIRKAVEGDSAVIGTKRTLKGIRAGDVASVYITKNVPTYVKEDLHHFCETAEIQLVELDITNKELGVVCKKPFLISVLSVKK